MDLDQVALEAAADVWAFLEASALMPASTETRAVQAAARQSFREQLVQLQITEQMLCHHLKAKLGRVEPPEGEWPPLASS
jgi:hypothetical protein